MTNNKKDNKKGFTMIELIIVMAIMAVLVGMTFLNLLPQNKLKEFNTTVEKIVSLLNTARDRSKFQQDDISWAVGLGNPFCSSTQPFFGLYEKNGINPKNKYVLPNSISFSSPNFNNSSSSCLSEYKIILINFTSFQGFLSGSPASATFSVFMKINPNISSTISVSPIGMVSFSPPSTSTAPYVPPPVLSNGLPIGVLPIGTTQTIISLDTDKDATCKYSTVANTAYDSMLGTFTTTGATNHSTLVTNLQNGQTYYYYVRCKDVLENKNLSDFLISFSVYLDIMPPAAIDDLSVGGIGDLGIAQTDVSLASIFSLAAGGGGGISGSVFLTWTAPGEDGIGSTGAVSSYDLRYSVSPIYDFSSPVVKNFWWSAAFQAVGEPALPQSPGMVENMTISNLTLGTTYYFAIKSSDEVPNISAISNIVSASPSPSP